MANSFWQREKGMKKMNSTILFSSFGKLQNFRKLLVKEEVEGSSKRFRNQLARVCCLENECIKYKTKPCFYRLFMSGQENHFEEL